MKKRILFSQVLFRFILVFLFIFIIPIILIGCASENEIQKDVMLEKISQEDLAKEQYDKALMEINEKNITNVVNLDKRYTHLKNLIEMIASGEQELKMVHFAGIKIELDYLQIEGYNQQKIDFLWNDFIKAFSEVEKTVEEEVVDSSYSLRDRYYTLEKKMEQISFGNVELTVPQYILMERGLKSLESDGYPENRINELKSQLFTEVIAELESGIINYGVTIEELAGVDQLEIIEKENFGDVKESEEFTENVGGESEVNDDENFPVGPQTFVVELIEGGFGTSTLIININDTVKWRNARKGRYNMALVLGNRQCRDIKSGIFRTGETYNWTFLDPVICWVSDGIFTTQAMKIIVS